MVKTILYVMMCLVAWEMASLSRAAEVPVRTVVTKLNKGGAKTMETNYRHRTFASYLTNDALRKITKAGNYSSFVNPLGIYFRIGEKVTLTVSGPVGEGRIRLIVHDFGQGGAHAEYPLNVGKNVLTMKGEGLGYFDYRCEKLDTAPPVRVSIAGGKINGIFTRADSAATWKRLLADAKCNILDLMGERCQLTYDVESLRKGCPERGPELLAFYDRLMRLQQEDILGWNRDGTHPGNPIHGRVMWGGYMHADGYGAAFHVNTIAGISNPDALSKGAWGVAHEFGHVNQTKRGMCWTGMTEVTNNICSSWTNYKVNPKEMRLEHEVISNADGERMRGGRFDCYVNNALVQRRLWIYHGGPDSGNPATLNKRGGDSFVTLCPYWQLQLYMAVARRKTDFYPNIYHDVRTTDESKMTNGEVQLLFMKRACDSAKMDLTDFFLQLGMLSPMDRLVNDYSSQYITITREMCEDVLRYAARYPKPDSSVIYYITANTVEIFRDRLPVKKAAKRLKPDAIVNNRLEIAADAWRNAVAFEAYRGNELLRISLRGLNHQDPMATTVVCPPGTDTVKAVQWDGRRYTVLAP